MAEREHACRAGTLTKFVFLPLLSIKSPPAYALSHFGDCIDIIMPPESFDAYASNASCQPAPIPSKKCITFRPLIASPPQFYTDVMEIASPFRTPRKPTAHN